MNGVVVYQKVVEGLIKRLKDRIYRVMKVTTSREMDLLEGQVGYLATIGSSAPFVGLFGTVWGIMNSFQSIAQASDTSLAVVAPGIAEALLATALGLVAAIPHRRQASLGQDGWPFGPGPRPSSIAQALRDRLPRREAAACRSGEASRAGGQAGPSRPRRIPAEAVGASLQGGRCLRRDRDGRHARA